MCTHTCMLGGKEGLKIDCSRIPHTQCSVDGALVMQKSRICIWVIQAIVDDALIDDA